MIHQYKLNGYNIVLDVYSGSVHAVDDVAYDAIALLDAGNSRPATAAALAERYADRPEVTPADIEDCLADIDELKAAGQLFAPDVYEPYAFDFKTVRPLSRALCPACGPHLQPELFVLLCRAGQVPRRSRPDEL